MIRFALALIGALAAASNMYSQDCAPTPQTLAISVPSDSAEAEVFGDHEFYQVLSNGWVFALRRSKFGWSVRIYDREPIGDAVDLTAMTPPLRHAPNPRDIDGWHFRNADNTGPNNGDVNAPQRLRGFVISPSLAGTGGLRLPKEPIDPSPDDGIGWLRILDFGLDNSEPGAKARMNYLNFNACVSWPRSEAEQMTYSESTRLEFSPEDSETYGACGLSLGTHTLSAAFSPRQLGGDLDGDGALDEVAQILRSTDGRRGLALCRAGTWLDMIDLETDRVTGLRDGFVGQVEAWQWISQDEALPLHLTGYEMPEADGDYLVLERFEKEAFVLFWHDGKLQAKRMYGHVEP
ncbi:hypothetical protein RYZ27_08980 [Hyphomonas sp. FCG-A18]|uniref:hypothetical protein n=1 Tax=Hyphomonas sp. FCG-A18 TaxID=3080019 RepID=UPI002B290703|nr:hypothetical protein RYZ27_08980 [Hyphomonas sp. FCG-A18]